MLFIISIYLYFLLHGGTQGQVVQLGVIPGKVTIR